MKKYFIVFFVAILSLGLTSCEDVIPIDIDPGTSQLVIDAFLNNKPETQKIRLVMSSNYFENKPSPGALGAKVSVSDALGRTFVFADQGNGDYTYTHPLTDTLPFGIPGNFYSLKIEYNGETYTSEAAMNRVPPIDSLYYLPEEFTFNATGQYKNGYRLYMRSTDPVGPYDVYWFKVYRNDTLLMKPNNVNIAIDAAFGPESDGLEFIPPIQFGLTPRLYIAGEKAKVEIHSINAVTYQWLIDAVSQMTNAGLFATPPYNVRSNIRSSSEAKEKKAVGWFEMSAVSSASIDFK